MKKHGAAPMADRLDNLEARVKAKSEAEDKSSSRQAASRPSASRSPSSKRLDSFEAKILAKSAEEDRSRSRGTSPGSAPSYEDRLKRKLSEGNSRASSTSRSSRNLGDLEAKILAKSAEGDKMRSRGTSPASAPSRPSASRSPSSRRLDSFEARIAAKNKKEDENRSRGRSPASAPSYEDRLKHKLSASSTSASSSRRLDELQARVAAKNREGREQQGKQSGGSDAVQSRFQEAFEKARSRNTMKDIEHSEERRVSKLQGRGRSSRSPSPMTTSGDSYEEKIRKKMEEGAKSSSSRRSSRSPSPMTTSGDSYEEKIRKKMEEGAANKKEKDDDASMSSFELKLQKKLSEGKKGGSKRSKK